MTKSKKYNYVIAQDEASWNVEIIRRVTARSSVVTKSQSGFGTEAEAQAWGEAEVNALLKKTNLSELNKRRARTNK